MNRTLIESLKKEHADFLSRGWTVHAQHAADAIAHYGGTIEDIESLTITEAASAPIEPVAPKPRAKKGV